ncbi:hypothetical protein EX30DRAFT_236018 [Ascodesmis nigricans]|uniref:Uncharacterized protein n=1 Tax=Ascodesmis nigricans TaxID=341454 RepID=A0A4S2MYM1_9PEZI|nr:hypothetical protein EX30DRAFT_236018 [Ascodesmis nigricans]
MSYNPSLERSPERYKLRPYPIPPPPPPRPTSYTSNSPSSSPTRSPERSPNRRPHSHQPRNSASAPFLPYSEPTFSPISAFNPKKITEEALRPKKKKPQLSAPYVHLDFHANLADARIIRDDIPCPVNIRTVTIARWVGIVCRVLQALGAGGILVAFIAMRKMDDSTSWICRVPPGVAMLHTVYSIYHLSGKHRMRTPGSSKMYHLFSITIDMAAIAFYSFIALLTFRQYHMHPNMKWQTEFSDDKETLRKVVFGVFITTCGSGALTIVSLIISIYLIWACRKLQQLPPVSSLLESYIPRR